jgi:hypothetical protein
MIKALALDLDGTLTNSHKELTERTRSAVMAVARQGIHLILASGRPVLGIKPLAQKLGMYEDGGFILAYNGGRIIDCKSNSIIFEKLLPRKYYISICQIARDFGVHALTYDTEAVIAECDEAQYVKKEAYNNNISIRKVRCLESEIKTEVVKLMIVGEPDKISAAMAALKKRTNNEINVFTSEPYFMEITAQGIEKASALAFLMRYLNINKNNLCAIGDGHNDIPMLEYAGLAVAMGNAYDEVKQIANAITDTNDNDGAAKFIEERLLVK